jgi:hypothetical protein
VIKKPVLIERRPVRLFSVNGGKLWFSKPQDVREFKQRQAAKARLQHTFGECDARQLHSARAS